MMEGTSILLLDNMGEGQILAQNVLSAGGQVLLCKGTLLTPKLQKMLIDRGYTEVLIQTPQTAFAVEEISTRLDAMFERNETTPSMMELRALFERFHRREGASE